jgi:hypothetical protein
MLKAFDAGKRISFNQKVNYLETWIVIHINMFPLLPWAINFIEWSMLSAKAKLPLGLENIDKPKVRL